MRYCQNCGTQLADEAKFCRKCGAPQPVETQPAVPSASPAAEAASSAPAAPEPVPAQGTPSAPAQSAPAAPTPQQAAPKAPETAQPVPAPQSVTTPAPKQKFPRWVLVLLVLALVFAVYWFFIRKDPVQAVQEYIFTDYGSAPFGVVADTVLPGLSWSSTGSGSNYTVTASGTYMFVPVSLTFQVTYAGDYPYVRFLSAMALGEYETDADYVIGDLYYEYYDRVPGYGW